MKKIWVVFLAAGVLLAFPGPVSARPSTDGRPQRALDEWFSGIGEKMDRAGQDFAQVFFGRADTD